MLGELFNRMFFKARVEDNLQEKDKKTFEEEYSIAQSWNIPSDKEVFLFFTHHWGGGIERHVNDLTCLLHSAGALVFLAQPSETGQIEIRLVQDESGAFCTFDQEWGAGKFSQLLKAIKITHVHIHALVKFRNDTSDFLIEALGAAGLAYDVTLHDYIPVCPRIHLINGDNLYCGEPDIAGCQTCINSNGSHFGVVDMVEWRARFDRLLHHARRVFSPNIDVVARFGRYFPDLKLTLKPHIEIKVQPVRIALIGTLVAHKGSRIVAATAKAARRTHLPLRFIIVGQTDRDEEFASFGNVEISGAYQEHEALDRLKAAKADLVWFASTWPETYSYTLSIALDAGLRCLSFDMGAIAVRITETHSGTVLPWSLSSTPYVLINHLMKAAGDPLADSAAHLSAYYELPQERLSKSALLD